MNMECSDDLYRRVHRAFEEPDFITDDCYRYISFNWLGDCPIQEKGLCSIHREKGEGLLPKICRLYPRSLKRINGINVASCSSSCEAVVELLYDNDNMNLTTETLGQEAELHYDVDEKDIQLIRNFQQILKDRSTTLVQSIYDICLIINEQEFIRDYNTRRNPLKEALSLLKRFSISNQRLQETAEAVIERYAENSELYDLDRLEFEKDFPGWMEFFERVINNSMIYENFPFVDSRADKTDAYRGLCVCYGLLRVLCIGNHFFNPDKEGLIDAVSALFHLIDHTAFYYNISIIADNAAIMLKL